MNCCKSAGKETLGLIVVNGFQCIMISIYIFIRMHSISIVSKMAGYRIEEGRKNLT